MTIRDKKEGGASRPVKVITSADLKENGGRYTISSKIAQPVIVDEAGRGVTGGPIGHAVYIVTEAEIAAGDFKVAGGSGLVVADSSTFVPSRSTAAGFQATPVYVVSGTLGGGGTGVVTDGQGNELVFDTGEPYVFNEIGDLPVITNTETSPADDFLHMWDTATGGAKKILIRDFGANISRIQHAYFRVYRNAALNPSDNAWYLMNWDTEAEDSHNGFNLSTDRYTVPSGQAGFWWFHCVLSLRPWAYTRVRFSINNAAKFYGFDTNTSAVNPEAPDNTEAIFYWDMDEGDYVDIDFYHHQTQNFDVSAAQTFFEGARIGPPLS